MVIVAAVVATLTLDGALVDDGSNFAVVELEVPAGIVEIELAHSSDSVDTTLEWGLWAPDGFRGWGGVAESAAVGASAATPGYLPGPIDEGTWKVVIGKADVASYPAAYSLTVTLHDAETLQPRPRAPFGPVVLSNSSDWYTGDLHVHSSESGDGDASFDEIAAAMRRRGLDFAALADHNTISQHALLARYQETVEDLLLIRAQEMTTYRGRAVAYGAPDYVDHRLGLAGRTAADMIGDAAGQAGALLSLNLQPCDTDPSCADCDWPQADLPWNQIAALEIQTGNAAPALARWDQLLDAGYRITAVAGSGAHRASEPALGSPATAVFARSFSEVEILAGVREGRAVVRLAGADGPMLTLAATAPDGTSGQIGDELAGHELELALRATGADGLEAVLVRDGEELDRIAIAGDDWSHDLTVEVPEPGARYRIQIVDGASTALVTNHLYAVYAPPPDGGCGCASRGDGAPGAGLLALLVAGIVARRRR